MNLFLLLLIIPLSFADAPVCSQLGKILVDYEKDLAKSTINGCPNINLDEIYAGHEGLPTDKSYRDSKKCNSLSAIESELEKLKAELSITNGIVKLKQAVSDSQNNAAAGSQLEGMTFLSTLNSAQTIEILLASSTFKNESFLAKLKSLPPEKRTTAQHLKEAIVDYCKNNGAEMAKTDFNACNPKYFNPDEMAANEVWGMLERTTEVTPVQIEKWQNLLAIRKKNAAEGEDSKWSFTQMQDELGDAFKAIDNKQLLTREQLNAIKKLDNFDHAPEFLGGKRLLELKKANKSKLQQDSLLIHLADARLRQQYEAQSKLSTTYANYLYKFTSLTAEQKDDCEKAKFLVEKAKACVAHLEVAAKDTTEADLKDSLLPSIKASLKYADALATVENKCKAELVTSPIIPESCYKELSGDATELQTKIRQLNILKDKIGSQNQDKMIYRNFALKKWADKCSSYKTPMDQCDITDQFGISKNAMMVVQDSMEVALVFEPVPEAEVKAAALCEEEKNQRPGFEKTLCNMFKQTPVTVQTNNVPQVEAEQTPRLDADAEVNRDRMIGAGQGLLKDVLKSIFDYKFNSPVPNGVSPYPYNYSPYNYGNPPMGISDSILFNARYYGGYGFYMPTPGYRPYTAFGESSPLSAYKPVSTISPGRYFSR